MPLVLYGHPFSSYTQKALIALYENDTPFDFRCIGPETPQHSAEWLRRWPLRKFPLLVDGERQVVETSIIIEYLQIAHPGPVRLLPEDPMAALDVRFLDRFFDLHVMDAMQVAVDSALGRLPLKSGDGLALAAERLERAYAWLDTRLAGRTWAAGEDFTLADCAAAPSLFYADWTHRIPERFPVLRAYRTRLLARPSFAGRWTRRGRSGRCSPWGRRTGTESTDRARSSAGHGDGRAWNRCGRRAPCCPSGDL